MINKKNKKFADNYVDSAVVQKEIIKRLIQRLSFINISPERILDIGSGIGLGTENFLNIIHNLSILCWINLSNL